MASLKGLIRLWKQSQSRSHPYRYFSYYLLRHFGLTQYFTIRYQNCRFRLYANPVSAQLWYNYDDWHGTHDILFLKQVMRPGETFIDVGANVGTHAICLAKHLGTDSQVHAFEPHPLTYQRLLENIALNHLKNIKAYNLALGETEGTVAFTSLQSDDRNRVNIGDAPSESIIVPQQRLDALEFGRNPIGVLKIDVEGYELFVLRGAQKLLPQINCLYFEVAEAHFRCFDYTVSDLLTYLAQQGWQLFRFCEPKVLQPITPSYRTDAVENLVAVRSGDYLRERLAHSSYSILES